MLINIIVRLLGPFIGIVTLFVYTFFYSDLETKGYIYLVYWISISSGWVMYGFRNKILSDIKNGNVGSKGKYFWCMFFLGFFVYACVSYISYEESIYILMWPGVFSVFCILVVNIFVSVVYANLWYRDGLKFSYGLDAIIPLSLCLHAIIGLVIDLSILAVFFIYLISLSVYFLVFLKGMEVNYPKVDVGLIGASVNSQVVMLVSFFEVFFIPHMSSNDTIAYRWAMTITSLIVLIVGVVRQMRVLVRPSISKTAILAVTLFAMIVGVGSQLFSLLSWYYFLIFLCISLIIQGYFSMVAFSLYLNGKGFLVLSVSVLTLIFVFVLSLSLNEEINMRHLLLLKLQVVCFNLVITGVLALVFGREALE